MKSEFLLAFNEICESRSLSKDVVLEAIETALVSAFRRNVGVSSGQDIVAKVDPITGAATIYAEKEVVHSVENERTEVALEEARLIGEGSTDIGETIMVDSTPDDFGRIAAQTAKQVIVQRIREAEREQLFEDFADREGEIINGTVQSVTSQAVTVGLGRTEALLPRSQQVPGERYFPHDKLRAYVLEVRRSNKGPQIIVSRSHRNMLRRMLELEVPEIYNGLVEIKSVAREAGQRSKVAVFALQDGVDPVGACVGMRGVRIQSIVRELNDEKIDVIEWNADPRRFIAKALSPAKVSQVFLNPNAFNGKTATVVVADDQLSLAIGREGQNARLAAKLTGWRIDIKSLTEAAIEAQSKLDDPLVEDVKAKETVLLEHVEIVLAKKAAGRPITAEDFHTLNRLVSVVEGRFLEQAEAERKAEEKARETVPMLFWEMPLSILQLDEELENTLGEHKLKSVGDIMAGLAYSTEKFVARAGIDDQALALVQERMATTDFPKTELELSQLLGIEIEPEEEEVEEPPAEVEPEVEAEPVEEAPIQELEAAEEEPAPVEELAGPPVDLYEEPPPEIQLPAKPEPEPEPTPKPEKPPKRKRVITPARREEGEDLLTPKKKTRKRKRKLVYDEEAGEVIVERQRKRGRGQDWDDLID